MIAKKPFGVLIIPGFTDRIDAVSIMETPLTAMNLPYRIPILRGHGADSPEVLRGVTWQDWVTDAQAALQDLLVEAEKAILIGHRMGGLVASVRA